jgi:hypothetical protein
MYNILLINTDKYSYLFIYLRIRIVEIVYLIFKE